VLRHAFAAAVSGTAYRLKPPTGRMTTASRTKPAIRLAASVWVTVGDQEIGLDPNGHNTA
jgi:hypothetical protein